VDVEEDEQPRVSRLLHKKAQLVDVREAHELVVVGIVDAIIVEALSRP